MDVGKAVRYVFDDKQWSNKLLIGAVVTIVPIVNLAYMGYLTVLMNNVSRGDAEPLPDWSNFSDKFVKGLILTVASLIYSLPILVLFICPAIFAVMGNIGRDDGRGAAGLFVGTTVLVGLFSVVYGLFISFLIPAINLNFARKNTFNSCFEFREIIAIMKHNLGDYIMAWLFAIVIGVLASVAVSVVTGILVFIPCLGWIAAWVLAMVAGVWGGTVYAHLFGQVGAQLPDRSLTPGS